ncbi:MAG: DNA translocase FtsK 4TM domain-containing protein, partial [Oceanisphaera sp.]|nr:DNA translocase FtsK 4TM domain-containing protein [Oceanisphaera sp.]
MSGLQRLFEAGLIIIILLAIFMMLSLVSYHASDPGWSQTAWGGDIRNAAGPAGAWLADILLFAFGFSAYLVPFFMVLIGWVTLWRPRSLSDICYLTLSLRIIGFLMLLLSLLALASMNVGNIYYFSSGGLIGDMLASALTSMFGSLGTTLVLLCGFATGVTFFSGWSWLLIVERLGAAVLNAPLWFSQIPQRLVDWQSGVGRRGHSHSKPAASTQTVAVAEAEPRMPEAGFVGWRRFKERLGSQEESDTDSEPEWEAELDDPLLARVAVSTETRAPIQKKTPPVRKEPVLGTVSEQDTVIATLAEANGWTLDDDNDEELDLPWLKEDEAPAAPASVSAPATPAPVVSKRRDLSPLPSVELLDLPKPRQHTVSEAELDRIAR